VPVGAAANFFTNVKWFLRVRVELCSIMTKIIPTLRVFDYAKTLEFYVDWLGFTVEGAYKPPGSPFWMQVAIRDVVISLSEHHGDGSPGANISIVEFAGLEAYHGSLLDKHYKYMKPGLHKVEWEPNTWEMTVVDPFFNRLIFNEPLKYDNEP
jgi:catechol 2,3-dioxygenase-like lactoylglutathione lyase family enzyme